MDFAMKVGAVILGIPIAMFLTYLFVRVICRAWFRTMEEFKNKRGE